MSVWQNFRTGDSFINGVKVTDENHDQLITEDMRNQVLEQLHRLIMKAELIWPGVPNLPERKRLMFILERCEFDIRNPD